MAVVIVWYEWLWIRSGGQQIMILLLLTKDYLSHIETKNIYNEIAMAIGLYIS